MIQDCKGQLTFNLDTIEGEDRLQRMLQAENLCTMIFQFKEFLHRLSKDYPSADLDTIQERFELLYDEYARVAMDAFH